MNFHPSSSQHHSESLCSVPCAPDLELSAGGVQGVLEEVGVVAASLQQHEDVLQLQVDLDVQRVLQLQIHYWRTPEERTKDKRQKDY